MRISVTLLPVFFILSNHTLLFSYGIDNQDNSTNDDFANRDDDVECVELADFYYEIVMGVTSFPQGDCNEQEQSEIAAFLELKINDELRIIPGTINTKNKICSNIVNNQRQLQLIPNNRQSLSRHNETFTSNTSSTTFSPILVREQYFSDDRILLRHGRRSFIFVGGGRCRYCFYDNADLRRALSQVIKGLSIPEEDNDSRHLLYLPVPKTNKQLPTVADILLCKRVIPFTLFFESFKWRNERDFHEKTTPLHVQMGPYTAGESFGIQADVNQAVRLRLEKRYGKGAARTTNMKKLPVKEGTIRFSLLVFGLPANSATEMPGVDDFYLFINRIKLDFALLLSEPGAKKSRTRSHGNSFAGIKWQIIRMVNRGVVRQSDPDKKYLFQITAPLIVLAHKNVLDVDFVIKPDAKAQQYAMTGFRLFLQAAQCQVTDLENSPFEDFQSVVESRLFHKLGKDLARQFQGREGHCLYDKIPVVDIHLVEKETWKDSNPRCDG